MSEPENQYPRWNLDGLPGVRGIAEVMLVSEHVAAVAAAENIWRAYLLADDENSNASAYRQGFVDGAAAGVREMAKIRPATSDEGNTE